MLEHNANGGVVGEEPDCSTAVVTVKNALFVVLVLVVRNDVGFCPSSDEITSQ